MAFRSKTCVVAVCDLCGNSRDQDGGEPHFDTEAGAVDFVVSDPDLDTGGWYQRPNGRLVCWRRDPVHDKAREEDGQFAPGPDAMNVTFNDLDPEDPNPPYDLPDGATSWSDWKGE